MFLDLYRSGKGMYYSNFTSRQATDNGKVGWKLNPLKRSSMNKYRNAAFLSKLLWLIACCCTASASHAQDALPGEVSAALRDAQIAQTSISALVLPIQGGTPRLAHLDERPVAPASTMKLVTTLIALEELGPTFRWQTQLLSGGVLKGTSLRGPLYLRGGGDPNLSWDSLRTLLRSLRAQGIRRLDGDLILDRSYFQPARPDIGAPQFDESPDAYYNVIPDALLLNGNLIEFTVESDQRHTSVLTQPQLDQVRIDARLTLTDTPCEAWDDNWDRPRTQMKANGSVALILRGAFPRNCKKTTRLNLLDRNLYIERFVRAAWKELGGTWKGKAIDGLTPQNARLLAERASSTLADAVRPINKTSDNAMTRTLYLTLGTQWSKEGRSDNTFDNAGNSIRNWFAKKGITTEGLVFENGSGLSRVERISPRQMAGLLQAGARSNWFAEFSSSIPIIGIEVRKSLQESVAASRARIKTGSLRDVSAIAGYVRDKNDQDWIVVATINDPEAKKGRPALDALINWVAAGVSP